jgi:chromosome partitioning protein
MDLIGGYAKNPIIDAGGQDSVELRAALTIAQLAVFPIQPSLFDAATLETLAQLVAQAQSFNPDLIAGIVINRASTNPRVKESEEAKELITEYSDLHLMDALIRDRIAFRRSARNGLCVMELNEHDKAAERELAGLYQEVYDNA